MSALDFVQVESATSLGPSLFKQLVNEAAWTIYNTYPNASLSFKVLKVVPITIKLSDLRPLWIDLFGDPVKSQNPTT